MDKGKYPLELGIYLKNGRLWQTIMVTEAELQRRADLADDIAEEIKDASGGQKAPTES